MAVVKLWSDEEIDASPRVKHVIDDIKRVRNTKFINNFWRGLANQPEVLEATWERLKSVMSEDGALDPLTKELIYVAVSIANNCTYCIHSHTASARARGLSDEQYAEFLAVVGMAFQTNGLVTALQTPVDPQFDQLAKG